MRLTTNASRHRVKVLSYTRASITEQSHGKQ